MKKFTLLSIMLGITLTTIAQEKYAVLICGKNPVEEEYIIAMAETGWADPGDTIRNEFWNDTFLMWEMLVYKKDYDNDNVFVLYYDGYDYDVQGLADRYNAEVIHNEYYPITDYSATKANLENVFTGLATGTGVFPLVTENDFLFVWTFGHGTVEIPGMPYIILYPKVEYSDVQFAAQADKISCYKRVFWMQQCLGGSFADNLENTSTIFHSAGSAGEPAAPADNNWDTENEIINGTIYQHGEFDFHVYSSTIGKSPAYSNYYDTEPYTYADLNLDNYISIYESWKWEQTHETKNETPLYSDIGSIGLFTSLDYPTLLYQDITENETHRGLIGVSKDIHITDGHELIFYENAKVHLLNQTKIIVDPGGTLNIGGNVTITGKHNNNRIIVNGNIMFGQNTTFEAEENILWQVHLNNTSLQTSIDNVSFTQCELHNYGQSLTITNSTFTDCEGVYSLSGDITVSGNTGFTNTGLYLANQGLGNNYLASVSDCIFTNVPGSNLQAVSLWNYEYYNITNNTIEGYYDGIYLSYSGNTTSENLSITDNHISNCTNSAISAYNSRASNVRNYLHNNQSGVKLYNNSNVAFYGNSGAGTYYETNFITDNDGYELYASTGSFPWYFRYNAIVDDDNQGNPTDPMVYWEAPPPPIPLKDVRYNCWGEEFVPAEDLYPGFMVYPTWCPGGGGQKSSELALQDFLDGIEQFENEEYSDAKSTFESVIDDYTETQYAAAAMKELFALEQFLDNDYAALQQYYETNDSIQADTVLAKLSTFLGNKCDIALENWQTAIDHFEAIIENPESPEDSIFAIIDLGYTYLLMENNGYKSSAIGKMPEHKPGSFEGFAGKRDYLLSLLPFEYQKEIIGNEPLQTKPAELQKIVPNPFTGTTTVYYYLKEQGNISIKVFDYLGKEVKRHDLQNQAKGSHSFTLNMNDLPAGVYFCSIYVDGYMTDTKKMILK